MTDTATKRQAVLSALDDPVQWGSSARSQPLSAETLENYQKAIDSVIGVTRDNASIAKLVWNGDERYWRTICLEWDSVGKPIRFIKRPILLYRSVYDDHHKLLYDIPVPRYLILTRMEREQYAPGWARDSRVWIPERGQYVQVKPEEPPDEWYLWFMTIASHDGVCCSLEPQRTCYGKYADPGLGVRELEKAQAGIEAQGLTDAPFDSPDRLTQKLREVGVNNYAEQAIYAHCEQVSRFIDNVPYKEVRQVLKDHLGRDIDDMIKTGV